MGLDWKGKIKIVKGKILISFKTPLTCVQCRWNLLPGTSHQLSLIAFQNIAVVSFLKCFL